MTAEPLEYDLLVTRDDVVAYLDSVGLLGLVSADAASAEVVEVTAGNMNRVFIARGSLGSVAIKQAPPWVQVAGPGWPIDPGRIASEARTYERLQARVPESIPTIIHFDEARYVLVMQDLSQFSVLRDVLVAELAGRTVGADARADAERDGLFERFDWGLVGDVVGRFVGELTRSTSLEVLGADAFASLVAEAANPELCALTIDVVFDEPYREHEHNHWHSALDERVRALYGDTAVRASVARLRDTFESRPQGLLHGDLHTGSVMVMAGAAGSTGEQQTKIFDPEFSFVGPVGFDLGLFWANMLIAGIAARALGDVEVALAREAALSRSLDAFATSWGDDASLASIEADAWGFAGLELMRRAAGYSHAADLETLPPEVAGAAAVELFDRARALILGAGSATGIHRRAKTPAIHLKRD
ncbi:phosphotransferase [Subtercola endophyticus]|uniref:phosphotransferase n=1 Tax=Subtercola endophyticus TaxID=2895559 RepID=UPI001E40DB3D|nr:phosphotransferase [Subtercola endophyticus]UFS59347.1 phosphotransferase [Subtercola endophyticus]